MKLLKYIIKFIIAFLRLNKKIVCEMSAGLGPWSDFHDYPDDEIGIPWHMTKLKCKRCGKEFYI